MLDSAILEVIIGMVFIFSLLSILVTQINSIISTSLRLRARHLRDGIDRLITDPVLTAKLLTHPLVRLVNADMVLPDQKITEEQAREIIQSTVNHLNYIDPQMFANVLMNLIRADSDPELFGALLNIIDSMPAGGPRRKLRLIVNQLINTGEGLNELREAIANLEEPAYREALTEALDQIDDEFGRLGLEPSSVISLMAGLRNVKNPYFRTALETILATSHTLEEAEKQIITWFNDGMSRASDAFTRRMEIISIIVGLLIAVVLNVDSIQVGRTLWEDSALRAAVAAAAREAELPDVTVASAEAGDATATTTTTIPEETDDDTPLEDLGEALTEAGSTIETLFNLRLPIGWRYENLSTRSEDPLYHQLLRDPGNLWNYIPGNNPSWLRLWLLKFLGLVATVIAIAQGAPFWFNMLNRLTGGRGSKE